MEAVVIPPNNQFNTSFDNNNRTFGASLSLDMSYGVLPTTNSLPFVPNHSHNNAHYFPPPEFHAWPSSHGLYSMPPPSSLTHTNQGLLATPQNSWYSYNQNTQFLPFNQSHTQAPVKHNSFVHHQKSKTKKASSLTLSNSRQNEWKDTAKSKEVSGKETIQLGENSSVFEKLQHIGELIKEPKKKLPCIPKKPEPNDIPRGRNSSKKRYDKVTKKSSGESTIISKTANKAMEKSSLSSVIDAYGGLPDSQEVKENSNEGNSSPSVDASKGQKQKNYNGKPCNSQEVHMEGDCIQKITNDFASKGTHQDLKGMGSSHNGEGDIWQENWAGPAYTKSPPPSSLPLPRFSMRQLRSVSSELPLKPHDDEIDDAIAYAISGSHSAPASPTRSPPKHKSKMQGLTEDVASSATKSLKQILGLESSA